MEELVTRLKEKVGLSDVAARRAVDVVIEFLSSEAPAGAMEDLAAAVPGLSDVLSRCSRESNVPLSTRHFGGMARLMQVADRMMSAGMTMAQVQQATHEVVAFARERAGDEAVNRIVTAIPGLRQVA
ncbi:DUF2267 domain-containing protein [Aquabacter sp. L1I39]|uniref:DUF2267 domain-containing protein n=1 Tax=Aquabacter sp. L1I39 TaxID=2820278 RepID=UPI001ADAB859|nr:DUF2267 domain-containing protein [Aquabacter sp. L1I39]QTL02366.1 DUF2267 domain-containing protein [Aquabacter sp. L1I39]